MKIRIGFVSNSSSASFIINKKNLSRKQIDLIKNHYEEGYKLQKENGAPDRYVLEDYYEEGRKDDIWKLKETEEEITVATTMTNFNMKTFLIDIGLEEDKDFVSGDDFLGYDWED